MTFRAAYCPTWLWTRRFVGLLRYQHQQVNSHNSQHYFQALFYGVRCTFPSVVPVPLAPAEADHLWDVSMWLTDKSNTDIIRTKDFVLLHQGRRMHCIIYHLCQRTAAGGHARNRILCGGFRNWYGNVLVSWANNDWPPNLTPKEDDFLKVLYSS